MHDSTFGLVIHGGAGVIVRPDLTPEFEAQYRAKLAETLDTGYAVLEGGGTCLDAVVAAIKVMEDSPLFNSGHGAVMNAEGACELDASIMDGRTLDAGAVAGLQHIRNPIVLARDVLERTPHVMLIGGGAEAFAWQLGYEFVPNQYFQTEHRRRQLVMARELEQRASGAARSSHERVTFATVDDNKLGTVGCAALDRQGNLAAGTSTGGMTNKQYGRVGDSPIIGAGTYAKNATCALSATGHGEFFIRSWSTRGCPLTRPPRRRSGRWRSSAAPVVSSPSTATEMLPRPLIRPVCTVATGSPVGRGRSKSSAQRTAEKGVPRRRGRVSGPAWWFDCAFASVRTRTFGTPTTSAIAPPPPRPPLTSPRARAGWEKPGAGRG
jgi:beta-aspartyl-peptidase (threonine type)